MQLRMRLYSLRALRALTCVLRSRRRKGFGFDLAGCQLNLTKCQMLVRGRSLYTY